MAKVQLDWKRLFDLCTGFVLLVCVSPILIAVASLLYCTMGTPILFVQQRPGHRGNSFNLQKFRTMRIVQPNNGIEARDEDRITLVGEWLRSTSVDELPELWNVLKGDMSLVGPRPLLVEYLPLYNERQAKRHEVRPGITGWAQINGRNAVSWDERLEMDVWYVENQSFWLDLKILWLTVFAVLSRKGINQPGHATCAPFRGSPMNDSDVTTQLNKVRTVAFAPPTRPSSDGLDTTTSES